MKATILACAMFLSACAFTPQEVSIQPIRVAAEKEQTAAAPVLIPVKIMVEDKRPEAKRTVIGQWGPVGKSQPISLSKDFNAELKTVVVDALRKKGFVESDKAAPVLSISLTQLDYVNSYAFWKITLCVNATLHVKAKHNDKVFEQDYKGALEDASFSAPSQEKNSLYINQALSDAAHAFASDEALKKFLHPKP